MQNLLQDMHYGLRGLLKHPGFTIVALLSLALGIGANTAIFSLINAILLKPLSFHDPDRLVMVWEDASFAGFPRNTPAPANYADWKAQSKTIEDFSATAWRDFNLTGDGGPEKVMAFGVTANFFALLGIKPLLGRSFLPEEDKSGANNVVVISHRLWQSRFGGERSIIGKDILLNNEKFKIVGVTPAGFQFLESYIDLWVPIALTQEELANRGSHYLTVIARMKPGITFKQANTEIQTIQQRIARQYPAASRIGAYLLPLREQLTGDVQRPLIVLMVAVGFVLLIACANIANLLLSRAANRYKEIAIRNALGANRLRIVRQLLTECFMLSFVGAGFGLLLALWSFDFLRQMIPAEMILSTELKIDLYVLGYTVIISVITGVIFGLAPALRATKIDLNEALKQAGGRTGLGTGNRRLRSALVVGEVSLAIVLLVGAGLIIQTFYKLVDQYSGFRPDNLLTLRTSLPMKKYEEHARRVAFYDQVLERVKSLPGVVSVGYTTSVPLSWKGGASGFVIEGRSAKEMIAMGLSFDANHREVSSDYLKTMNIPLRRGRYINESDSIDSMPVAVINETMARQYWPNVEALGKRFKIGDPDSQVPWMTIVGIVADHPQMGLDVPVRAEMYLPYRQVSNHPWFAPRDMAIRTTVDPRSIVSAVRSEVFAVDPTQPISSVDTMSELLEKETVNRRIGMVLLTAFAGLALLLASLGIYGVLSYFVAQQTAEIGLRLALGAKTRDIFGLVMKKGMGLVLLGIAIGLVASLALMRLISSLLFGITATDFRTFGAIAILLTTIALLACIIPARRATKVDPMVALRYE